MNGSYLQGRLGAAISGVDQLPTLANSANGLVNLQPYKDSFWFSSRRATGSQRVVFDFNSRQLVIQPVFIWRSEDIFEI